MKEGIENSNGLSKDGLHIKMVPNASRTDRNKLTNSLLAIIDDSNLMMIDGKSFEEDIAKNMKLLDFFNYVTAAICFILGAF
jgi:hypothetical protein